MENKPNRIIWHHSADASTLPQALKIDAYHKTRGFTKSVLGYFGGYHYLIEHDGTTFQYRRENEIGCHDADENINSIGICLAGNFDIDLPTAAQQFTFQVLLSRLMADYAIPISRIDPHRMGDATHCPGLRLPDDWARSLLPSSPTKDIANRLRQIASELDNL